MINFKTYLVASKEALKNLTSKYATVLFPREEVITPFSFRGSPILDPKLCTICKKCERACPTTAISIIQLNDDEAHFSIDLGKCCYCQECENTCNFDAINLSNKWKNSAFERADLITTYKIIKKKKAKVSK